MCPWYYLVWWRKVWIDGWGVGGLLGSWAVFQRVCLIWLDVGLVDLISLGVIESLCFRVSLSLFRYPCWGGMVQQEFKNSQGVTLFKAF
jgi:hypothetical protein